MQYDANDEQKSIEIVETWHQLMEKKIIQVKKVFQRIPKEELATKQLQDPIIASGIEKFGYYDVATAPWPEHTLDVLDFFVKLGYVDKFLDNIHQVSYHHEVHPYEPYIFPSGGVGITAPGKSSTKIIDLDSKKYLNFIKTARDFKNQVISGKHPHITEFNFGENFHYQSDVYEVKDRYFDAIDIGYLSNTHSITIHLTEPEIFTHKNVPRKRWKRSKQLDPHLFLSGNQFIDRFVDELNWKKDYIGIIIYDNQPYTRLYDLPEKEEDDDKYLAMPKFLGDGVYSVANIYSNKFEDVTGDHLADYLSKSGDYFTVKKRLKPSYLHGKEVDVLAEQMGKENVLMIICECKLKFSNSLITEAEIGEFREKVEAIKENESKSRPNIIFSGWLVTNSENISDELKSYASILNIEIKKADLSRNWKKRADWKITTLTNC